jgi:hypothetical protein
VAHFARICGLELHRGTTVVQSRHGEGERGEEHAHGQCDSCYCLRARWSVDRPADTSSAGICFAEITTWCDADCLRRMYRTPHDASFLDLAFTLLPSQTVESMLLPSQTMDSMLLPS